MADVDTKDMTEDQLMRHRLKKHGVVKMEWEATSKSHLVWQKDFPNPTGTGLMDENSEEYFELRAVEQYMERNQIKVLTP